MTDYDFWYAIAIEIGNDRLVIPEVLVISPKPPRTSLLKMSSLVHLCVPS